MANLTDTEPVALVGAITTALVATVNIPALLFAWDGEVVAAVNIAIGAWAAVGAWFARNRVTPVKR